MGGVYEAGEEQTRRPPGLYTPSMIGPGTADITIIEPLCAVFRRKLSSLGLKYTPERALVLDAVMRVPEPFQADALIDLLRQRGQPASKATVYRTIKLLQDAGIIQPIPLDSEHASYVLAYGRRSSLILVRSDTGRVETIDQADVQSLCERICAERGLRLEGHRLIVFARSASAPA